MCSSVNLYELTKARTSLSPAKMAYSPSNGFLRKKRSNTAMVVCRFVRKYAYAIVIWYMSVSRALVRLSVGLKRSWVPDKVSQRVSEPIATTKQRHCTEDF